jgi:hypothetical protein
MLEITSDYLLKVRHILEILFSCSPRTVQAGKKISWVDGYEAVCTLT